MSILENFGVQPLAQGPPREVSPEDIARDLIGFTHPNLHMRVVRPSTHTPTIRYYFGIFGFNNWRTVIVPVHEEGSTTSEIP